MELKEGMYVRTIEGIYQLPKKGYELQEHLKYYNNFYINGDWFEKASYNKIDLIEVGDYVNGHLVKIFKEELEVWVYLDCPLSTGYYTISELNNLGGVNKHIKSIVTHKQFKANEYIFED